MVQTRVHCCICCCSGNIVENGEVLDCGVLSKRCSTCSRWNERDKNSDEYEKWYEGHKDRCSLNHVGSSPAMESEGVRRLWQRSVSRLGLRYTQVICDGDSKPYATVRDAAPYGDKQVIKHECVGHVQKRVGKYLRDLKKCKTLKDKDAKPSVFNRRLTDASINKLQTYYGNAIRANVGNVKSMKQACWAVFCHSCSHDKNPQHNYCRKDKDTWCICNYNRALVEGRRPVHTKPPRIPPDLAGFVKNSWDKLCEPELLKRCVLGATQNQNESFNNIVWKYCHKTDFSGLISVRIQPLISPLLLLTKECAL